MKKVLLAGCVLLALCGSAHAADVYGTAVACENANGVHVEMEFDLDNKVVHFHATNGKIYDMPMYDPWVAPTRYETRNEYGFSKPTLVKEFFSARFIDSAGEIRKYMREPKSTLGAYWSGNLNGTQKYYYGCRVKY